MKFKADARWLYTRDDGFRVPYVESPNVSGVGRTWAPRGIVLHDDAYHVGKSAPRDVFADPEQRVSAHHTVDRNGRVTQSVPHDRRAWHAGTSRYQGVNGVNAIAFGVEMNNPGQMDRTPNGGLAWFGTVYEDRQYDMGFKDTEHHDPGMYWMHYTAAQIDTVVNVCQALVHAFDLEFITTHWAISPGRKQDPNPFFPLAAVRNRVFGGSAPVINPDGKDGAVVVNTNLRRWPATSSEIIMVVPREHRVTVIRSGVYDGARWFLIDYGTDVSDNEGWVHGSLLDLDQ